MAAARRDRAAEVDLPPPHADRDELRKAATAHGAPILLDPDGASWVLTSGARYVSPAAHKN